MGNSFTVHLTPDMSEELDRLSKDAGVSRSEIIRASVRDYIFARRYRNLRAQMVLHASSKGVHTDQDVFDRVS
jgi:metal-responsive CopG/Arc/MetJ family transcriptional regulator